MNAKANKFMKRSKVFLGVTTGLLAFAALAAKKAAYTQVQRAYTGVLSGGFCTRQYDHVGNTKFAAGAIAIGFTNTVGSNDKLCNDKVWAAE